MDNKAAADGTSNVPTTAIAGDPTGGVTSGSEGAPKVSVTHVAMSPRDGLALGLLVAAAMIMLIGATYPIFQVPERFHIGMNAPTDAILANRRATDMVLRYHAMLYVGSMGFLLGALLGLQEGILRRAWFTPIAATVLGSLSGVLGGFLGCLVYEYVRTKVGQAELMHTILAQWLLGAPLGFGVGFGLGLATRTTSGALKAALAGLAAATLAAILFPVLVSIVLPAASTDALLPEERGSRLLWLVILTGLIGLVIPLAGRRR